MSPVSRRSKLKQFFSTLISGSYKGRTSEQDLLDNSSSPTRETSESPSEFTRGNGREARYSHKGSSRPTASNVAMMHGSQVKPMVLEQENNRTSKTWPEDTPNITVKGAHAFNNAHDFVMMNPTMILGEDSGDRLKNVMKSLSENIIIGAAHDDCARDPPPRCHPGTRIHLLKQITVWFYDASRRELLWINGPAGVGKSAILQTFAEILDKSMHLGASVFISRHNGRNDPRRIFITIAYQLALRIEDYRTYIVELLNLNPDVVNKGLREQFRSFIIEPFVGKRIGAGGKPWGILLDGLDEIDGQDKQRNIIRIISTFSQENVHVPLAWIISSRCERHISLTFNDEDIRQSYLNQHIRINTTEACRDVERYLRSEFEGMRKEFPDTVGKDWPSQTSFLKLAATASGFFIFAETAIRFIKDPDYASPMQQLGLILSSIDHAMIISSNGDQPLSHLDALYAQILDSIPARSWPTTKRLFGFALVMSRSEVKEFRKFRPSSQSLRALSIILGLSQDIIYSCLAKCYSVLAIPPWTDPYDSFRFLHASFADYLVDSTRSGSYYISVNDAEDDFILSCINLLQDFIWVYPFGLGNTSALWNQYCGQRYSETQRINSMTISPFNEFLFQDIVLVVSSEAIDRHKPDRLGSQVSQEHSKCLDALRNICSFNLCGHFDHGQRKIFVEQTFNAWKEYPHQLEKNGLVFETKLKNLNFDHLDNDKMCPAHTRSREVHNFPYQDTCRPRSCEEVTMYVHDLKRIQGHLPDIRVLVCGIATGSRCALFCVEGWEFTWKRYYIIPHPH